MLFSREEHRKSRCHSLPLLAVLLPFSWFTLNPLAAAPVITSADHLALPEGETITLTGTGLGTATAARMLWAGFDFPATVNPVNDTTLEVVMPDVFQDIREHLLIVETPDGSTVAVPATFIEQTSTGSSGTAPAGAPVVVRAGGVRDGGSPGSAIIVEAGGVLRNPPNTIIIAENAAVVDFTGVSSLSSARFYYSPGTVIIGTLPTGLTARQLTPIKASHGIGTFTVGYGIDLTVIGDGTVTAVPNQTYYRRSTAVTLTATPGANSTFSGWSGEVNSSTNPLTVSAGTSPISLSATFSAGWLLKTYNIPGVTVTANPTGPVYPNGTVVSLSATVDPDYEFFNWVGDASGTELTTSVTMIGNRTILPVVRPISDATIPQATGADHLALPEGETITLTGTGLGTATAARMLWAGFNFPATVTPVDDTTLGVVMPDVFQDIREHLLIVETADGSTVAVPATFIEQTSTGSSGTAPAGAPVVVRAGGVRDGGSPGSAIIVEAGGVLRNPPNTIIIAENAAVVDFTGVSSLSSARFYYSPGTVIIGTLPTGLTARQLTPIKASHGIGTFTVGYGIDLTVIGDGTVTAVPNQTYYRRSTNVTLTATPGANNTFSGWSGDENSSTNPLTIRTGSAPLSLSATFSAGWLLNIYNIPGITVTADPNGSVHADGTVVNLSATVDPGYEFFGWARDASGTALTTSVTMDGNLTILPVVRPTADATIPQIASADHLALPEGETITLTGTGLGTATGAHMLWAGFDFPATVTPVNDTTLEVVMPDVFQDIRQHVLLVESPDGSTVAIPSTFIEQTSTGSSGTAPPGTPIVVRAGGILSGGNSAYPIVVETGGVLTNPPNTIIIAENGAVVDFTGVSSLSSSAQFYYSPGTVIVGALPTGLSARILTPIKASHGIGTFTVGYPLNLSVEGPGTVTVSPEKAFYTPNETVTLTATPDEGAFFIRWIGGPANNLPSTTYRVRRDSEVIARFSTAPDYFSTWRLEHFTVEELADLTISAFDADPDKDSLTNAAEYALGSDPRTADGKRSLSIKALIIDGELRQFVEYYRPKNALDVTYQILLSTDTLTWNSNGDDTGILYSVEKSVENIDEETELVTVEVFPDTDTPRIFFARISALLF